MLIWTSFDIKKRIVHTKTHSAKIILWMRRKAGTSINFSNEDKMNEDTYENVTQLHGLYLL